MQMQLAIAVLASATGLATPQHQDARSVLQAMAERQAARWETVDDYTVFQATRGIGEVSGLEVPLHYKKYLFDGRPTFGLVPPNEYEYARQQEEGAGMDAEGLRQYADASEMVGDALATEVANSGMPLLPGMDPREMMSENAFFLRKAADAQDEAAAGDFGEANARASLRAFDEMASVLRLIGTETVDGREAYHLRAEGLGRVLTEPGAEQTFTLETVDLWIDVEQYVQLRMLLGGTIEREGRTEEMTIERLSQDYRQVGPLYEPHRQVMRMSGLMEAMDPEQRAELEEAREQLKRLEAQLDQMPAAARGMVEGQIERMRAQMEMLSEGGGIEIVTEVLRIEIDQGPPPPPSSG